MSDKKKKIPKDTSSPVSQPKQADQKEVKQEQKEEKSPKVEQNNQQNTSPKKNNKKKSEEKKQEQSSPVQVAPQIEAKEEPIQQPIEQATFVEEKKQKQEKRRNVDQGVGMVKAVLSGDSIVVLHSDLFERQISLSNVSAPRLGRFKGDSTTKDDVNQFIYSFYFIILSFS